MSLHADLDSLGARLDSGFPLSVLNGGIVQPGDDTVDLPLPGKVLRNEQRQKSSSQTTPRQWTPRTWPWQTAGTRTPSKTPPFICKALRQCYEPQLDEVQQAYPGTKVWSDQAEGLMCLVESSILYGLPKKAVFLAAIPYLPGHPVKSWAFWVTPLSVDWIGPRHTNFADGSICAFDPADGSWNPGGSLVELFDLYTVWALRHEYLQQKGRWPGYQSVPFLRERLTEFQSEELCGCEHSSLRYSDCCKEKDLKNSCVGEAISYWFHICGQKHRAPPECITRFIWQRKDPPSLRSLFS